ncbi:hypothetical protein CALVIDRAFT_555959 [Calocera viscosa TUFC12733]|uniref:NACHT domain-containing protein n=1 Tax=Calocera viscosa (strain TUFC12733) TaxID=1330018 RepID=A0A167KSQ3_CALVF|nr:hypothetical protein CALVIDRAFT_555959 [Calocera viscosa TUFC12733]
MSASNQVVPFSPLQRQNTSGGQSTSTSRTVGSVAGLSLKAKEVLHGVKTAAANRTAHIAKTTIELVETLDDSIKEWKEFGDHVEAHVALLLQCLSDPAIQSGSIRGHLETLYITLRELLDEARAERSTVQKLKSLARQPESTVASMRDRLDRTLGLFNFSFNIMNRTDVARLLVSVTDMERVIPELTRKLDESIDAEHGPKVFWLTGPAGSGKTTVAHTVSKTAQEAGILLLSFFFSRMVPHRTSPNRLITALARAVATTDKRRALQIASVLQDDAGLASTSVTRQFQELVVRPASSGSQSVTRYVIVIDGVDECMDPEERLLAILTSGTSALPRWLRIVVTSRPFSNSHSLLEEATHITNHNFDLQSYDHWNDMKLYMSHRLELVARKRHKVLPWPAEDLMGSLIRRSDGLFLWASTVMDFMENHINPERHIRALLSLEGAPEAEARMDEVYAMVLSACPWDDEDFVAGYHLYMGMVEVGDRFSMSRMQELSTRPDISPLDIFGYFRCLLHNWDDNDKPVQALHSTFLGYICYRAPAPFRLNLVDTHTALAEGCIALLNEELVFDHSGILSAASLDESGWSGRLDSSRAMEYVPHLMAFSAQFKRYRDLSRDAARYACSRWFWHLSRGDIPESLREELSVLLTTGHFVPWLCLCVVFLYDYLPSADEIYGVMEDILIWMEVSLLPFPIFRHIVTLLQEHRNWLPNSYAQIFSIELLDKMEALSRWLFYSSLPDPPSKMASICERLAEGSVIIARTLSGRSPDFDGAKLARALQTQAVVSTGFSEARKKIMEEAISIHRQSSIGEAGSHHLGLAICLSEAARYVLSQKSTREEAIAAAEEAVEIFASIGLQPEMSVVTERLRCLNVLLQWRGLDPQTLQDAVEGWRDVTNTASSTFITELPDTLLHVIKSRTSQGDLLGATDASEELLSVLRSERERLDGNMRRYCPRKLLESASLLLFEHGSHQGLGLLSECFALRQTDTEWAEGREWFYSSIPYYEDLQCAEAIYAALAKYLPMHTEHATVPTEWLPARFQLK